MSTTSQVLQIRKVRILRIGLENKLEMSKKKIKVQECSQTPRNPKKSLPKLIVTDKPTL